MFQQLGVKTINGGGDMIKAILTGHSRGLGAALARALTRRGVHVLGASRTRDAELTAACGGLLTQVALDLGDTGSLLRWIDDPHTPAAPAAFLKDAQTALLINNAGILRPIGPVGGGGPGAAALATAVNVAAPLALTEAFVALTARGPAAADRRVLHISSGAGRSAYPGWSVYCATKAALDQHARAAALDEVHGLRIASLAPGVIDTGMQAEIRETPESRFPLRDRFVALKQDGGLAAPDEAGDRIVNYLLGAAFGDDPAPDLRRL
jgi:benzil reductase ((S)-benzoin forming)